MNSKKKKLLIVIYPYKFSEFLWQTLELDKLSQFIDVEVWDISFLLNRRFFNGIFATSTERTNVKQFKNFSDLHRYRADFRKKTSKSEKYFINEITLSTFKSVFFYRYLLRGVSGEKVLELLNPGFPTSYNQTALNDKSSSEKVAEIYEISSTQREVFIRYLSALLFKVGIFFTKPRTYKLIAGSKWEEISSKIDIRKKTKIIYGHSNDVSKCINMSKEIDHDTQIDKITHLDTAAPMFETDSLLIYRKTYTTIDVWYPALNRFFTHIEERYKLPVTVAGHYKSGFSSPSPIFDGRQVIYGETVKLIASSKVVTTQYSTATSIAVYLKKPIVFIYSNELKEDREAMQHIVGFSKLLDSSLVNIDEINNQTEIKVSINRTMYEEYFKNYLSSGDGETSNYELILDEFLKINNH